MDALSRRGITLAATLGLVLALAAGSLSHPVRAQTSHRAPSRAGMSMHMGKAHMNAQPTWQGFYDGRKDTYLNTDVSDKAQAAAMHVNFAPGLKQVPAAKTPAIYLVEGRAAANQLAVFGSEPGEADYSPLWHEVIVTWKSGAKAALLTSDNQINSLAAKGKLTARQTSVLLNCPIIKVGK